MKTRASEFDRAFDEGEDVTDKLEVEKARRINYETRRVNVDFPDWMTRALDHESKRLGITRQALIDQAVDCQPAGSEESFMSLKP